MSINPVKAGVMPSPEQLGLKAMTFEEVWHHISHMESGEVWEPLLHPFSTGSISVTRHGHKYHVQGGLIDYGTCEVFGASIDAEIVSSIATAKVVYGLRGGFYGLWKKIGE